MAKQELQESQYDKLKIHDRMSWRFNNWTRNQWNLKHLVPILRQKIELRALVDKFFASLREDKEESGGE